MNRAPHPADTAGDERLWTRQQVADYLGVASRTTYMLRLPTIYLTRRSVRFDPQAIKRWAAARSRGGPVFHQGRG